MKLNSQLGWPFKLNLLTIPTFLPSFLLQLTSRMSITYKGTLLGAVKDSEMIISWSALKELICSNEGI